MDVQLAICFGLDGQGHALSGVTRALLLLDALGQRLDHLDLLLLGLHLGLVLRGALGVLSALDLVALGGGFALGALGFCLALLALAEAFPLAFPHALFARVGFCVGGGALHALCFFLGLLQALLLVCDGFLALFDEQGLPFVEVGVVGFAGGGLADGRDPLAVFCEGDGGALECVGLDLGLLLLEEGELRVVFDFLDGPGVVVGGGAGLDDVFLGLLAAVGDGAQAVVLPARDLCLLPLALVVDVAQALAGGDGGDGGALGEDLVDLERLVARLDFLLNGSVAGCVNGEELVRGLLSDDTTVQALAQSKGI